jgi:hypothetical protein
VLRIRIVPLAGVVLSALGAAAPAGADEYHFTLVDAFTLNYGLRECYIYDINEMGMACGTATIQQGSNITYTGFYWTAAAEKTPVGISWPHAISNTGLMAGVAQIYNINTGQVTNVPLLPNTYYPLALLGINDAGAAVGYVQTCNCSNSQGYFQVPYIWEEGDGAWALPVSGGNGAARINNNRLVVGWIGGWAMTNGFVYDLNTNQQFLVSSLFAGPNIQTTAVDVADNDVIVGWRKEQNGNVSYGYTWSADQGVTLLPLPPAGYQPHFRPAGVNTSGVVVGSIYTPTGSSRAAVYDPVNGVRDLNTLTTPLSGFTLMAATAINNQGWIVGYGYGGGGMYKSYVLAPIARGDLDCDGDTDFDDINPFVLALSDPTAYQTAFPTCPLRNGDCDADGDVDFDDVNAFVALLSAR